MAAAAVSGVGDGSRRASGVGVSGGVAGWTDTLPGSTGATGDSAGGAPRCAAVEGMAVVAAGTSSGAGVSGVRLSRGRNHDAIPRVASSAIIARAALSAIAGATSRYRRSPSISVGMISACRPSRSRNSTLRASASGASRQDPSTTKPESSAPAGAANASRRAAAQAARRARRLFVYRGHRSGSRADTRRLLACMNTCYRARSKGRGRAVGSRVMGRPSRKCRVGRAGPQSRRLGQCRVRNWVISGRTRCWRPPRAAHRSAGRRPAPDAARARREPGTTTARARRWPSRAHW